MGGTDHDHPWRNSVVRRIASAAVVAVALLAAYGCGTSGNDTSVGTGHRRDRAVQPAAADDTGAPQGLKTVTYQGVQFDVPAEWPVHDLAAEPTTCVRFDVNAVYLGHPSADMDCPAGLVGRAEAVLVEPADGNGHGQSDAASSGGVAATSASGLELQVASDGAATSQVDATIPSAGVSVTLTYRDTDATAQQILASFRTVAP
jgi:hypothetical protein